MAEAGHCDTDDKSMGALYVVATPMGNLGDVTLRALEVLKAVDCIAAEDTRITTRLLDRYGIHARLLAMHEHNEQRMAGRVLELLAAGSSVALVSDAGTPSISDPGARLVAAARSAGYNVSPVPGPNAAIAALSASGLDAPHFLFYGFLPPRHAERMREITALATLAYPLVFYEAPHRVLESVADLAAALGPSRRLVIARELTKRYESIHDCDLGEAAAWLAGEPHRTRGEFVLIVTGAQPQAGTDLGAARNVLEVLLSELPVKQAVSLATRLTGGRRNELYDLALSMKGG